MTDNDNDFWLPNYGDNANADNTLKAFWAQPECPMGHERIEREGAECIIPADSCDPAGLYVAPNRRGRRHPELFKKQVEAERARALRLGVLYAW